MATPTTGYDPKHIESKWQAYWRREGTHNADLKTARNPYYVLMMFPYPSAEGLHVGNVFAFTGADVHGRYKRHCGFDVFEPIGFDAFGIHSENYALKVGRHPQELIPANVENFTRQLRMMGFMHDWNHVVNSTSPDYYRWTQWIFLKLYKAGLAVRKEAPVTWCPECMTVVSDEFVDAEGCCDRHPDTEVEERMMTQWFFRITAYAESLHANLEWINWSDSTKKMQREWLGRSEDGSFRLRDWCISRQRYWGPPIPMIHCSTCGVVPVPEEDLPVELPYVKEFRPLGTGVSPLAACEDWVNVACPACGGPARRETDVSDNFLDSAWYYLRYPSAHENERAFDPEMSRKWLPVDCYVGGNEHACLHLLYTRFISMALCDHAGLQVGEKADKRDVREPFLRFQANGMIRRDGAKMSKNRGNVVNPDDIAEKYGADTLRVYLLYLGRFEQGCDWRDDAVHGVRRFLDRVYEFFFTPEKCVSTEEAIDMRLHQAIRKVTEDIESFSYNTAISALMMLLNEFRNASAVSREAREAFCIMLSPFAPHLAEEIWCEALGNAPPVADAAWPEYDPSRCVTEFVEIAVQVNGKVRGRVSVPRGAGEAALREAVKACPNAQRYIEGKREVKFLIVPDRLVNVIVR